MTEERLTAQQAYEAFDAERQKLQSLLAQDSELKELLNQFSLEIIDSWPNHTDLCYRVSELASDMGESAENLKNAVQQLDYAIIRRNRGMEDKQTES